MKRIGAVLAAAWGFAEATLFFVVPDVPISAIAARAGFRAGVIAALWATGGALLGGAVLYLWAAADASGLVPVLDLVPAVSLDQIAAVERQVLLDWGRATIQGGFSGTPYKLYAAAAGAQGVALGPFLAISLVARLSRFLLGAVAAWLLARLLTRLGFERFVLPLLGLWWTGFYAWYWIRMPW